ncbi:MAG: LVIVD repeat-containing protein [Thermoplasmatota archaeon]
MRLVVVLALVASFIAGCLAPHAPSASPGEPPAGTYDAIEAAIGTPINGTHDHTDGSLHTHHYNLDRVAIANGYGDGVTPPNGAAYAETAVKNGYAYLTRYGPDSGLVIFDVHDIEHPKQVGSIRLDEGFEPDIEVSDDGNWAFWETQRFPITPTTPSPDPGANAPHGVDIIDIHDKAHPKWAGFYPVPPDGPHSITYANIGGRNILFLSIYAFAYAYENVEVPNAQRLEITELVPPSDATGSAVCSRGSSRDCVAGAAGLASLKLLATYREPGATGAPGLFPHDVSVSVHPVTGKTLAYVAYWNVGVVTLDVSDPANPQHVNTYTDFGPAKYRSIHMVRIFPEKIDGKVVGVVQPEIGGAPDTGYLTFFDDTDPAHPSYISSWKLPGNLTSQGLRFSPHYFDLSEGRVAIANYHAGLWVIDVHDAANLGHPRSVAFAEMSSSRPPFGIGPLTFEEGAFDAWWVGDHVVAGDALEGLAGYRYLGPSPNSV